MDSNHFYPMESKVKTMFLALCAIILVSPSVKSSEFGSLAWQLLPQNLEDLPMEFESDEHGQWTELWLREKDKERGLPRSFMEQALGVRWVGMDPDKSGRPKRIILVYAQRNIVDITEPKTQTGKIDQFNGKITWSDGASESIIGNRRRARRKRGKAINFGKISLPPLTPRSKEFPSQAFLGIGEFISQVPLATELPWNRTQLGFLYALSDPKMSMLKFHYNQGCSEEDRTLLDNLIAQEVEPKLTCWAEQNPEKSMLLVAALMQRPLVDCRLRKQDTCGNASIPLVDAFFATAPQIDLNFGACKEEMGSTLLHETLHLAGIKDGPDLDHAIEQAESCNSAPAQLAYEGNSDEFVNDLQVETRISIFRRVRDEATEKWGWTEGEKDFVMAQVCTKMGDKFCARRYFQQASEEYSPAMIPLQGGGEVTFKSAAHFGLYDSITEDLPRMHELSRYLSHDPNGALLRLQETDIHRLHEFFVARSTLEKIKSNKGICNSETDEKVSCEDLSAIVKTPWFRTP